MTLKTGIGIGLLASGWTLVICANLVLYKIKEELVERFPERIDWLLGNSTRETFEMFKVSKIWQLYKREFPARNKPTIALSLYASGLVALLTGFSMIVQFRSK